MGTGESTLRMTAPNLRLRPRGRCLPGTPLEEVSGMERMLLVALFAVALLLPATAFGAAPPPGAQLSDNLEYVNRVPGAGLVEGKFDTVAGRDVLVTGGEVGV